MTGQKFNLRKFINDRMVIRKNSGYIPTSSQDIIDAYNAGHRDFSNSIILNQSFNSVDLSGADFRFSEIIGTVFQKCILSKCDFRQTVITRSEIRRSTVEQSQFSHTDFNLTSLVFSNFLDSKFDSCNFIQCSMRDSHYDNVDFEFSDLSCCDMASSSFLKADFNSANLIGANLFGASLNGADFDGADISQAYLELASFDDANLLNTYGIYTVFGRNLSSRRDFLTAKIMRDELNFGKLKLYFMAGCQDEVSGKRLLEMVEDVHDGDVHGYNYKTAITAIKAMFKADMKFGRWDYLLKLDDEKSQVEEK